MIQLFKPDLHGIKIIGVTGTRGKTTIVHLLQHLLQSESTKVALLSSSGYSIDGKNLQRDFNIHTIKRRQLLSFLKRCQQDNVQFLVLEMPALKIRRKLFDGIELDYGILTNLHNDSIPLFNSVDEYKKAKLQFIQKIKDEGSLVIDSDNPASEQFITEIANDIEKNIYVVKASDSDISTVEHYIDGQKISTKELGTLVTRLVGQYNSKNVLLATMLAQLITNKEYITQALRTFSPVHGRMDLYKTTPHLIFIDYARNHETLRNSLQHIKSTKNNGSRVITVFGAPTGGPIAREMGKVAKELSDLVILTSQDPNTNDVSAINTDIHTHIGDFGSVLLERFTSNDEYEMRSIDKLFSKIEDIIGIGDVPFISFDENHYMSRLNAIDFAIKSARPGDIIYITGKGNETSTLYNNIEYEWSDYEAVNLVHKNIHS